jgi:hypothetical protein
MPEVISKHPEVTIRVLEDGGAVCGEGVPQTILTECPPERFCATPNGEICVYGLDEIPLMTQISSEDIARAIAVVPVPPQEQAQAALPDFVSGAELFALISVALAVGVILGITLSRRKPSE